MSRRATRLIAFLGYVALLGALTLTPGAGEKLPSSWIPFDQIVDTVAREPELSQILIDLVGNVALFVPLGWLLRATWPRLTSLATLAIASACSLTIELAQLSIPGRSTSIDDVIVNALGALIGSMLFARTTT